GRVNLTRRRLLADEDRVRAVGLEGALPDERERDNLIAQLAAREPSSYRDRDHGYGDRDRSYGDRDRGGFGDRRGPGRDRDRGSFSDRRRDDRPRRRDY
ncbi:hypothetical protein, partial [Fretibacterium fastidiosum]